MLYCCLYFILYFEMVTNWIELNWNFPFRGLKMLIFKEKRCFFTLPEDRQGLVSYSFLLSSSSSSSFFFFFFLLLLSSGNTSFSHTSLHLILTKLAHSDRYLNHYSHTKDGGVRGHYGVTGVKKVIFTKNASSPSDYVASTRDFCICSSLTPSTKVMVLKNCQGSFGVTGVKSSFFLSFFFCHSFQLITSTCLNRFWPYLVTTTPSSTATCHMTNMASKVM